MIEYYTWPNGRTGFRLIDTSGILVQDSGPIYNDRAHAQAKAEGTRGSRFSTRADGTFGPKALKRMREFREPG